MRYSVIIPTLNGEKQIVSLLETLQTQSLPPSQILVVDSQSDDATVERAQSVAGVRVEMIRRQDFDHGGTRDWAIRRCDSDVVVLMTQDAMPTDGDCMKNLLAPLDDPKVAAVGGRQIAYPDARPFERLIRANNYPAESRVWAQTDIEKMGVRAFLISDVCAAYRKNAYLEVGGFDHPILTNEDMLMAEKLLHAGYKIAYSGKAAVYHSHRFTLRQEYRRNYIIGQTMKRYEERFEHVSETGTGVKLVKNVMLQLVREGHIGECFCFAANCAARFLGNRMGRRAEKKNDVPSKT